MYTVPCMYLSQPNTNLPDFRGFNGIYFTSILSSLYLWRHIFNMNNISTFYQNEIFVRITLNLMNFYMILQPSSWGNQSKVFIEGFLWIFHSLYQTTENDQTDEKWKFLAYFFQKSLIWNILNFSENVVWKIRCWTGLHNKYSFRANNQYNWNLNYEYNFDCGRKSIRKFFRTGFFHCVANAHYKCLKTFHSIHWRKNFHVFFVKYPSLN